MRYPPDHMDRVRRRILRAASRRFRGRGTEGVAIAELMRDLKLTHGGFYRHFAGKEELFREALAYGAAEAAARMLAVARRAPAGRELEAMIDAYLSPKHCANPAVGCPIAALATEIGRHSRETRSKFNRVVRDYVAALAPLMPGRSVAERERKAMVLFSGMAGVLNLARASSDETLRRTILRNGRAFYARAMRGSS